jgi:O-methyltransferase involved in polyketide biosynthesis
MSFAKQAALREELGSLPERVQSVSIDFNTQPVGDVLGRAGPPTAMHPSPSNDGALLRRFEL